MCFSSMVSSCMAATPIAVADRFRCALIGHYIVGEAEAVSEMVSSGVCAWTAAEVDLGVSEHGGPCGVWVDRDGEQVAVLEGIDTRYTS